MNFQKRITEGVSSRESRCRGCRKVIQIGDRIDYVSLRSGDRRWHYHPGCHKDLAPVVP